MVSKISFLRVIHAQNNSQNYNTAQNKQNVWHILVFTFILVFQVENKQFESNFRLEVKERPDVGVYVKDLSVFMVNNADDMDKLMTMGNKNRSIGATQMNAHSSRSHAIFSITVECSEKGPDGQQHFRYISKFCKSF